MIHKTHEKIELIEAQSIQPFSYFKNNLHQNDYILIATIPFARNLYEYTQGIKSEEYIKLTSLLHIKDDTFDINIGDLQELFNNIFSNEITLNNHETKVVELIFEKASDLLTSNDVIAKLENKIVLSIAIRLKAEIFMVTSIKDTSKTSNITKNKTYELIKIYKELNDNSETLDILDQVNLMTPENIHINSFMYEPILDMSDYHLKQLYSRILELQPQT